MREIRQFAFNFMQLRYLYQIYVFLIFILTFIPSFGHAHPIGQCILELNIGDSTIQGRLRISTADIAKVFRIDENQDQSQLNAIIAANKDLLITYLKKNVKIKSNDVPLTIEFKNLQFNNEKSFPSLTIFFELSNLSKVVDHLTLDSYFFSDLATYEQTFLIITYKSKKYSTVLHYNEHTKNVIFNHWKGFLQFIHLGIEHILTGYDHILFLITIILPVFLRRQDNTWIAEANLKKILVNMTKLITVFTFAHSITLIMAVSDLVTFPAKLVESVIALSIAFTALDNCFSFYTGRLWLLVMFFGFFHGLGFANVLRDMGLVKESLIYPLIGFNLGIEAGQLMMFLLISPILFFLSKKSFYPKVILKQGSFLIFLLAMYWLVQRIFI